MEKEKLLVRVIDVPHGVCAEDVERLLNEPSWFALLCVTAPQRPLWDYQRV